MINTTPNGSIMNRDIFPSESALVGTGGAEEFGHQVPDLTKGSACCERPQHERSLGIARGLCLILRHHDAPEPVINSFRTQILSYLDGSSSEKVFSKRAKHLMLAPMSKYLKNEAPSEPDLVLRWTGQFRRWAKPRLRNYCRKNTHLWYSFLQGKRSALPLTDELILITYQEHREAMGREDPIDDATFDLVWKVLKPVVEQVRRKMKSVPEFQNPKITDHTGSTRACFESSRDKGGQLGHLASIVPRVKRCNPTAPTSCREVPDFVGMTFFPRIVIDGVTRYNVTIDRYAYTHAEDEWFQTITRAAYRFTLPKITLKCTIQAILEPLKVRVISKGNAIPYYLSKPLQKSLHTAMRDMPCFRLIGRPISATDLIDLKQNACEVGTGPLEWLSIDYSAATDRLSARLSAAILEHIIQDADSSTKQMWKAVLAPHMCEYPFPYSKLVEPIQQKNGQLMGSILSFPILCLANLGLYLANLSDDRRSLKSKLNGVLINGDDMLYVAPRSKFESHTELGRRVGLEMSPGKAYHHNSYANVNSVCFTYPLDKPSTPYQIPFLNCGLYFGQSKVLGGDDHDGIRSLSSTINGLMDGCLFKKKAEVFKGFMHRHSSAIAKECKGRNLFIPTSLGGMGVKEIPGISYDITRGQKSLAYDIYAKDPCLWPGFGPLPGPEVPEEPTIHAPWLVPETIEPRLRVQKRRRENGFLRETLILQGVSRCGRPRPCKETYFGESVVTYDPERLPGPLRRRLNPAAELARDLYLEYEEPIRTDCQWTQLALDLETYLDYQEVFEDFKLQ